MLEADQLSPRRRLLVNAAIEVVAANGLRGLTHRAVDREAGLPEGSCSSGASGTSSPAARGTTSGPSR